MAHTPIPYLGEMLSLTTALLWALAVILFKKSGETVAPLAVNLFKNTVAFVLLVPTMLLLGVPFFLNLPAGSYVVVIVSGAIGIGIADTIFFHSLNVLGAGRAAIVEALYSPSVIFFSYLWLGERLDILQGGGAALILLAVLIATYTRYERKGPPVDRRILVRGVAWGALSQALMAVGLVMVKRTLNENPLLWVVEWRLVGGIGVLGLILLFDRHRRTILGTLAVRQGRGYLVAGSLVGAYLVLMTWLGGMKYSQASTASALNQTSTIFTFILAAILLREPVTKRRTIAIALAVAGALLVTFA